MQKETGPDPAAQCAAVAPISPEAAAAYRRSLLILRDANVPHVVGGAYAMAHCAGVVRHTKDFDLFIRPADRDRAMAALTQAGYRTEVVFPFWLAKAFAGDYMIDLIYRAPNGLAEVTDDWITHGIPCEILDVPTRVCAPAEMLITKLFVLNKDRTDLADVMHLFYACVESVDWAWLLRLLGPHWRVLLAHLVMFGYVFPAEKQRIPRQVLEELLRRLQHELTAPPATDPVCFGTLLSHDQYARDIATGRCKDARLRPYGSMSKLDLVDATISTDDPERPKHVEAAIKDGA